MERCDCCGRITLALIVRTRPKVTVTACLTCDRVDLWHQLAPATLLMAQAAHRSLRKEPRDDTTIGQ